MCNSQRRQRFWSYGTDVSTTGDLSRCSFKQLIILVLIRLEDRRANAKASDMKRPHNLRSSRRESYMHFHIRGKKGDMNSYRPHRKGQISQHRRKRTFSSLCQTEPFTSLSIRPRGYLCTSTNALWTSAVGVPVKPVSAAVRAPLNI